MALALGVVVGAAVLPPSRSSADPAAVRAKQAEVAALQAQLEALDMRLERAAEEYNGARYRLGIITQRMRTNRVTLAGANRDLRQTRSVLAERLVDLYTRPRPSLAEVLVTAGSVSGAVAGVDAIERAGRLDASVVENVRQFRGRVVRARLELIEDRGAARVEVREARRRQDEVAALMRERQSVLAGARADLRRLIEEERERQRRIAEQRRQAALAAQRAAAAARVEASRYAAAAPYSGPLPSGAGNGEAARIALSFQGVPYVWGGESPSGFDCSGLATYAYRQIGKSVPHYTGAAWSAFPQVPAGQLQPGDLVFFNGLGHMGIYIGNGQMVHAPHTGDVVRVASMSDRGDYVGAVRP